MLPLLPALILLFLQGPSNFERATIDGRLPAALDAIHRHLDRLGMEELSGRDQEALATLLAVGVDTQFSHAFFAFLNGGSVPPQTLIVATDEMGRPIMDTGDSPPPSDGFERGQRTRDGPATSGSVR